MYAVIRAGGKQYRVAPGDVIRVEKLNGANGDIEFNDVLAVANEGEIGRPQGDARVSAHVLGEVKGDKVLVFHFKKKKQYKKLQGHRQQYTTVRITEIAFDGQSFKAPEQPKPEPKPKKEPRTIEAAPEHESKGKPKAQAAKKPAPKKKAAAKPAAKPAKKGSTKKK